jgi:excisionase family DNA binding protein
VSSGPLIQVREAARQLGVHENTLRRWEQSGLIGAIRLPSGVRRFRAEDVERLREEIYETAPRARSRSMQAAAQSSVEELPKTKLRSAAQTA